MYNEGDGFKVIKGIVEGSRYIEILRPVNIDDVEITEDDCPKGSDGHYIQSILGRLITDRAFWKEALRITNEYCHTAEYEGFYDRQASNASASMKGLRKKSLARSEKNDAVIVECRNDFKENRDVHLANILVAINDSVHRVVDKINKKYEDSTVRTMTESSWDNIEEDEEVTALNTRLGEIREEEAKVVSQIQNRRNQVAKDLYSKDGEMTVEDGEGKPYEFPETVKQAILDKWGNGEAFKPQFRLR